jgi:CBS domain containing-hemolysin-like protein
MASSGPKSEGDSSGGIWRKLRSMIFGDIAEPTLREQIEEVIDEADEADDGLSSANGSSNHARDLSSIEREMLRNMLHFGEQTVDDVAVPRGDIIAISDSASFAEAIALFADADHSRLPVYREKLDDVVGMLHVKDLFGIIARGDEPPVSLSTLMRQPLYVPQSMSAMELLAEMRAKRTHLAIVLDEYGGTDGLVTIEDLMEEIVGEIEDEHDDAPEDLLVMVSDGVWDGDARIELEDLAERLDPRLVEVEGDVDTLGGLAFVLAGSVPQPGDVLHHDSGWTLTVLDGDERRVTRVRLSQPMLQTGSADL